MLPMDVNHGEGMRVGGPLPRWNAAQWARAEAIYEQVVAEENHSRARRKCPRPCTCRTAHAPAVAPSAAHDAHRRAAAARPSPRLLAFADALADFIADLHLNGRLDDERHEVVTTEDDPR